MQAQSKDGIFRTVEPDPRKKKPESVRGGSQGYAVLREGDEWGVFLLVIGGTDAGRGLKLISTWETETAAETEAKRLTKEKTC